MKKIFSILLTALMIFSLTACSAPKKEGTKDNTAKKSEKVMKIGYLPNEKKTEINNAMTSMAKYLETKTGIKTEFVPSTDYTALVTAFERGEIQLAWFGGFTGVQARSKVAGSEAIAQRPIDAKFKSVFISSKNAPYTDIKDVKGKSLTFGSETSTSGHLMPRYFLMQAGIDADKDLNGKPNFSGAHDKSIKLVESGAYQVAAVDMSVWDKFVKEKKVDLTKVKAFYTTPEFFDYNWTVNSDENLDKVFGEGTKKKIVDAILAMDASKSTEEKDVLTFMNADKFIPTQNSNYKLIEEVMTKTGLDKK
ncbi:putative selenate ABC transporter substrate-binding protein [Clostridium cylindrosporum]|uniref:Putative phosphite transport system-binding protein PtxB n=1 Tax=Clostridium cylindrosporum DSM 605 TaxID=1121307 RepID=A0A0J8D9V7_CLOCY|nr:putative selenate ABC transporter substrate-binding protein [Clostridium cylindrosporum]KMT22840.1 putative phosphite transport system-binding protein PtxB [Clostridium cylindrosporum DSM 605]